MLEFMPMRKIARWSREIVCSEKIDGTNSSVFISDDGSEFLCGSRNRWITPEKDNFGFAAWAMDHKAELMNLGPGHHFGEWWGSGIQRGYGLPQGEKRWSLFNVQRWCLHGETPKQLPTDRPDVTKPQEVLPACVGLVPVLWRGNMNDFDADAMIKHLKAHGSYAARFLNPEGIVICHVAGNVLFKKTIEGDEKPKGKKETV